jgi:phenylacetate-coenzyme A ligase PaaK-like adenylate-forming protein
MGALPPAALASMQAARFRRTLKLAAARSSFYREAFRHRGIQVERIEHPSQLGDFYTTGEDLRSHGADAFLT